MLIGQYTSKLTNKNRLAVPKKFRDEMGNKLVVARWYEECLILVSESSWQSLLNQLGNDKTLLIEPKRDIERFVYGQAFELDLDEQGRFVLPETLMVYAQITDEVVFVGLGERVEIWSKEKWTDLEVQAGKRAMLALEKIGSK